MRRALFLLALALALCATAAIADAPRHSVGIERDPAPLTSRSQWVFDLRWDRGSVFLLGVRKVDLPQPMTTPRVMGRFALELTEQGKLVDGSAEGGTSQRMLVERARFDFPGMAVPDDDGGIQMIPKLRTRIGVFFPVTSRGDKLELVDRSTGQRWSLPWPPSAPDGGPG